jgi:nicotinate dehydrogenase subunit A
MKVPVAHVEEGTAISMSVNRVSRTVDADPDTPFLYVLRNDLGLVGTRFGCGSNQCGACFVLMDGHAVASCDTPLGSVGAAEVTTVEGLSESDVGAALQEAFLVEQAGQCGYCLSGMLVAATALLRADPDPSAADVRAALERNLCRCGSHNRIVRAVRRAAVTVAGR